MRYDPPSDEELLERLRELREAADSLRSESRWIADELARREAAGRTPEQRRQSMRERTREIGKGGALVAIGAALTWMWQRPKAIMATAAALAAFGGAVFIAPDVSDPPPAEVGTLPPPLAADPDPPLAPTPTPTSTSEPSPTPTPAPVPAGPPSPVPTSTAPTTNGGTPTPESTPSPPRDPDPEPTATLTQPPETPAPTIVPPTTPPPTPEPTQTTEPPPDPDPTIEPTPEPTIEPTPDPTPSPSPTDPPDKLPDDPTLEICLRLPPLIRELCLELL